MQAQPHAVALQSCYRLKNSIVDKLDFRWGFLSGDRSCLMRSTLGKIFNRWYIEIVFLFFPENTIFDNSWKLSPDAVLLQT